MEGWTPPPMVEEFRLERSLGRGATADVWLATDTLLARPVALKIARGAASAQARARFLLEARAVARLHHPNLIAIHTAGEVDRRPFLVTELLVGQSLAELPLPVEPARALAIALELARGLSAAHRAGVLHRDVKPANAFACADGAVKLIDFGLAKLADHGAGPSEPLSETVAIAALAETVPSSEEIVGTPLYMAPEAWRGDPATPRSDVYSLGVVIHELLTGRRPFEAGSLGELRERVLAGPAPALAAGPLAELALRCLARKPQARPTSEELRDALEALAGGGAPAAPADEGDGNPYRGLLPFGPEQRALFFGRDREVGAVLAELAWAPFVLVVGPSGAGKSSLVRAAVAPRVDQGALGPGWRVVTLVPGRRPLEALALAMASVTAPHVLVVADQLEEVWTLADEDERQRFAWALADLIRAAPAVRVVATLRADFLSRLEDLGELRESALQATVVLRPLAPEGLRRAICEPARRRGVELDEDLVERLTQDAGHGSLPLLSFTLGRMWEQREPGSARITGAVLDRLGGLEGALAAHADGVLAGLAADERTEARRLLVSLVTVEGTRARREEAELVRGGAAARRALAVLVEGRLVVAGEGEEGAAYEVAHEALIAGWPTLAGWLAEEKAAREARERIGRAAAEWARLGSGPEGLWAEAQLRGLADLADLGEREQAFLGASRRALARARRRRRTLVVGVPLVLAALAFAAWGTSVLLRRLEVAHVVGQARAAWREAEHAANAAAELRAQALASFDRDELGPAEEIWRRALVAEDSAEQLRKEMAVVLDRALTIDPRDRDARSLYADATLASLLAAERRHRAGLLAALRSRLALYDDGSRAARLSAPARVTVDSDPPGARFVLHRYVHDAGRRLVEADPQPLVAGEERSLAAGSYLVTSELAGRWPTRYPFVVERGEVRRLRVVLPPAAAIPDGMIYVPAGRFHYGSDDDEDTRVLLAQHPGRDIELPAFLIAREEVVNQDYVPFLDSLPASERRTHLPIQSRPAGKIDVGENGERLRLPVQQVSRDAGEHYAAWLAARLPGARLCTDREWERAARGADGRRYPHGDMDYPAPEEACTMLTYGTHVADAGPCLVGSHPASRSPFGVDDMTGSVDDWVAGDADRGRPGLGITRGGSWINDDLTLWLTSRSYVGHTGNGGIVGLRICADPPPDR